MGGEYAFLHFLIFSFILPAISNCVPNFSGHDTTTTAICFALLLLANNKECQDRVYQELIDTVGDIDRLPTFQELQNLPYLEMCIKETLRLYPSVPLIARLASKDITLSSGYEIPKDTNIVMHIYDLHHNPDVYPDPEKFDPDRFLPENTIKRHPFAFLPFSAGPRNCIGQKFAMLELKTVICGIVKNYELLPVDTPDSVILTQDLMIRTQNGININFKRRTSKNPIKVNI